MTNEIIYQGKPADTGNGNLKADLFNPDGTVNATAIPLTEIVPTYVFRGDFPASQPEGQYFVRIYDSTAATIIMGQGPMGWDGAKEITLLDSSIARKILQNDQVINPSGGIVTILDDDDATTYLAGTAYNDIATATTYNGTDGVNHRTRLA
jgi:hypothetical protein